MFDVIVIGGGHAGTEAATAAARRSASVAVVTFDRRHIGVMSCNPAIGGIGKGHIVREVDALDGVMAVAADRAAIHYRLLNRSKGSAVHGPRVQADRLRYAAAVQSVIEVSTIEVIEGDAVALTIAGGCLAGIELADGSRVSGRTVVLATGTFLGATLFRGNDRDTGGRVGERAAKPLADQLRALSLPMERLKTGTPPRLDGRTIDWAQLDEQRSDPDEWTMSPMSAGRPLPSVSCAITRTNAATHDIIRQSLDRSPLFSGAIGAPGPRYCPSIEDKIHRFGDRDGHQLFLEPEGLDDPLVYPNGLSTSLPTDVQQAVIASIPGLERAQIVVPGYAVEYDYLDPRSLDHMLALRAIPGVFCAGQINGTTGYEEAAGQGLIAGLNAAAYACDLAPITLDRASSYIGVMIDDLVLQGVTEPYRMLTARAEYRLSLRADNAETRLGPIARATGCVAEARYAHQLEREAHCAAASDALSVTMTPNAVAALGHSVAQDGVPRSISAWLGHGDIHLDTLAPALVEALPRDVLAEVAEDARYTPYLDRQRDEIARLRADEAIALPVQLDFAAVPGLSIEMTTRLATARPRSLAAASRIQGITPAALSAIHLYCQRRAT